VFNVIRILLLLACAYAGSAFAEMQLESSVSFLTQHDHDRAI